MLDIILKACFIRGMASELKNLKISPEVHQQVRIACAMTGEKMQTWVERAIQFSLPKEQQKPQKKGK